MAVYTKINKTLLESFLENYEIGRLITFNGIQEGVENSNYKLITSKGTYILTIFEKRVEKKDLPFFIKLKRHLVKKKFLCPKPISNKQGSFIYQIKDKPCLINSFLKGNKVTSVTVNHCQQLGKYLALMHIDTYDFKFSRQNSLSQEHWKKLFENFKHENHTNYRKIFNEINTELEFLERNWPKNLPLGVIHADVFQDNVFFDNDILSGIIDFYFACNDYYAYELAICINAWCFNNKTILDVNKIKALLNSYQNLRKLSESEKVALPVLLRGATIRFLLTRLNDEIYHTKEAYVEPKDPMEFFNILQFHKNNNILNSISL